MKKKIAMLSILFGLGCFALVGCGASVCDRVKNNMSEWTSVYFYGEGEGYSASLSSGERENVYLLNGKSEDNVDFALLSVRLEEEISAKIIKMQIDIDGESVEKELEINGMTGCYMVDLERRLTGDKKIVLNYGGTSLELSNISKDFAIDDEKAIEIGATQLQEKIIACKVGNTLNAECYLRVLDRFANDFDGVFWCFTVVNVDGESYSAIISTTDGSVLAKSE